ncbi:MAG TPA: efflux RND transporter periplasmic adaptor subunit, partial [Bradyrhizobium sp.]|nr:efflux RND transporter periplasmic adaptor subunit [Bradyrhizobium sp.]
MTIRNILVNRYFVFTVAILALAGGGIAWMQNRDATKVKYRLVAVKAGDVTQTVSANGTLNPVVLVNVGTQVSGTVKALHVDFNDHVKAGQTLLELDPALLQAQVRQDEASVSNAQASLDLAIANERRSVTLWQQDSIARQAVDESIQAHKSAQAQLDLARAQLAKDRTNLAYSVIRSPVSGVVVNRAVDIGQTVAASFQTPTLFQIAQDLRKMQIDSSFAEADVGNIKVGQPVQFTVDAFPNRAFTASVRQIRLNATTQQNVVTYDVVVAVDNLEEILMPGM